jgi:hypothetical protein
MRESFDDMLAAFDANIADATARELAHVTDEDLTKALARTFSAARAGDVDSADRLQLLAQFPALAAVCDRIEAIENERVRIYELERGLAQGSAAQHAVEAGWVAGECEDEARACREKLRQREAGVGAPSALIVEPTPPEDQREGSYDPGPAKTNRWTERTRQRRLSEPPQWTPERAYGPAKAHGLAKRAFDQWLLRRR